MSLFTFSSLVWCLVGVKGIYLLYLTLPIFVNFKPRPKIRTGHSSSSVTLGQCEYEKQRQERYDIDDDTHHLVDFAVAITMAVRHHTLLSGYRDQ